VHCVGGQLRALGRAKSGPADDLRPVATTDPSVPEWMQKVRRVDIEYFDLNPPIIVSEIADQVRRLHIAQGPFSVDGGLKQGYLFRFSIAGLKVLRGVNDAEWPPWAQSILRFGSSDIDAVDHFGQETRQRGFTPLLQNLERDGLHFSAETVGNYLLALQTKRFVILTGISGTGKTQLALAVARHFRQQVLQPRAITLADEALIRQVKPYMRTYNRLMLPVSFTASLDLPSPSNERNERQIRVIYPNGEQFLTLNRNPER